MRSSRPPSRNGCLLIRGGGLLLRRTEGSRQGTEREGIPPPPRINTAPGGDLRFANKLVLESRLSPRYTVHLWTDTKAKSTTANVICSSCWSFT